MALATSDSGTQLAVIDTEHTLETNAGVKSFMAYVNLTNLVAGDRVVIRVKIKVLTGGALVTFVEDVIWGDDIVGKSLEPGWYCPPIPSMFQYDLTLEQTDGTGRNFEWSVLEV